MRMPFGNFIVCCYAQKRASYLYVLVRIGATVELNCGTVATDDILKAF